MMDLDTKWMGLDQGLSHRASEGPFKCSPAQDEWHGCSPAEDFFLSFAPFLLCVAMVSVIAYVVWVLV